MLSPPDPTSATVCCLLRIVSRFVRFAHRAAQPVSHVVFFFFFRVPRRSAHTLALRPPLSVRYNAIVCKGPMTQDEVVRLAELLFPNRVYNGWRAAFGRRWLASFLKRHPELDIERKPQRFEEDKGEKAILALARAKTLIEQFEYALACGRITSDERVRRPNRTLLRSALSPFAIPVVSCSLSTKHQPTVVLHSSGLGPCTPHVERQARRLPPSRRSGR